MKYLKKKKTKEETNFICRSLFAQIDHQEKKACMHQENEKKRNLKLLLDRKRAS